MADHALVETVLSWLDNWDETNAPKPTLIDRDDAESESWQGRKVSYDLTRNHAASVASTPDRITTPVGTNYDHRVEDGVNVRLEGAHTDEHGTIADGDAWQAVVDEARRLVLAERITFPTVNGVDYHSVLIDNEANRSAQHKDYFAAEFDVVFRGFEELP